MKLLVSVRSGVEVRAAQTGGADIIDAKEPRHGSLGTVSPAVLSQIAARVAGEISLSVALGDLSSAISITAAVARLELPPRPAPLYLKLGFAGVRSPRRIERLTATAVAAAGKMPFRPVVIAVAYADAARAATATPDEISSAAARAGAGGTLLDTHVKDGLGLLRWMTPVMLQHWTRATRSQGLTTALAGSLELEDVDRVAAAEPDVLGVRGAVCVGGREGRVSRERVLAFRQRIASASGSLQVLLPGGAQSSGRETRDVGAKFSLQ